MKQIRDLEKNLLFAAIPTLQLLSSIYWDPCPSTRVTQQEARLLSMPNAVIEAREGTSEIRGFLFSLDDENRSMINEFSQPDIHLNSEQ